METRTTTNEQHLGATRVDTQRLWSGPDTPCEDNRLVRLYQMVLEQVDYGIACVDEGGQLIHSNGLARRDWLLVQADGGRVRAAIRAACTRGLRCLVEVQRSGAFLQVAVIPLPDRPQCGSRVVLLLGKSSVCERLSSYWYGVARGLSGAEQSVLDDLAAGWSPRDIATRHGVSLSTIRTQIASVRAKTGVDSMFALLREVAQLPPIRCSIA